MTAGPDTTQLLARIRQLELELAEARAKLPLPLSLWPGANAVEVRVRALVDGVQLAPVHVLVLADTVLEAEDMVALRARQLYRAIKAKPPA